MLKFILINGKAMSGKDTFAKYLSEYLLVMEKQPFIFHNATYVKLVAEKIFGWDKVKDNKGRKLLIDISNTGYDYDKYFWEKKTEEILINKFNTKNVYVIIPDFRYKNTYEYFKNKYKVLTIRIDRDFDNNLSNELKNDKSEKLIDIDFDFIIKNNESLDNLREQAKYLCDYFGWW